MFHSPGRITECLLASAQPPNVCPGVPALRGISGGECAPVLGRSSLKMPRNGVKNKHGPVSGFQPRALFSGRQGGRVREMSGISQPGGSGVSGHWVTSA